MRLPHSASLLLAICLVLGGAARADEDTSKLPRPSGAREIFASPGSTIFTSPDGVAATADAMTKGLEGLGWQRYIAPFTSYSNDPSSAILSFKKGAQGLSAYVTVAPAQNNATSVQLSLVPLAVDLPFPRGATQIEFAPGRPYLGALAAQSPDALMTFFRIELGARGWSPWSAKDFNAVSNADVMTEAGGHAHYVRGDKAMILVVQRQAGGVSKVTLDTESFKLLTTRPVAIAPPTPAPPSPAADKAGAAFDTMAADIMKQALAAQGLAGSARAKAPPVAIAASAPGEPLAAMANPETPIPLPANADGVEYDAEDGKLEFTSPASVRQVADFYRAALKALGWAERPSVINRDNMVVLELTKEKKKLRFTIMQMGPNANVSGSGTGLVAQASGGGKIAAASDGAPKAIVELEAEETGGLPVPVKHTFSGSDSAPFRHGANANVTANVASVVAFYRRELGKRGWSELAEKAVVKGDSADLAFTSPDGPATLKLARQGDETVVTLVVRDEAKARKSPLMPKPGQVTIVFGNMGKAAADVSVAGKSVKVAPGTGSKGPDGPTLQVPPGKYKVTLKGGKGDEINVGPDEIWGVLAGPGGVLALQVY